MRSSIVSAIKSVPEYLERMAFAARVLTNTLPEIDAELEFQEWLKYGFDRGWTSDVFCPEHSEFPLTYEEREFIEEYGSDGLCVPAIRIWTDMI